VLYGHGTDPIHITLPGHDLMLALKTANALLSIELDGNTQLALPKQVQRHPIKGFIEHADLLIVRRGEKVTVEVPIVLEGEAGPDTTVTLESPTVPLEVEATHIPQSIHVDIAGLPAGTLIHARDLKLPQGAVLAGSDDHMIVNIAAQVSQEALEAELAGAEEDLGVVHEAPAAEAGDGASTPAPESEQAPATA
jgi:large subunit ribosomal protein L25